MKKTYFMVGLVMAVSCSMTMSSCFGSFNLTRKLYSWNQSIGDKWIQEIAFIALGCVGVYGIVSFADVVVLNTIEFWSGSNPVASGEIKVKGHNGEDFLVSRDANGATVTNANGDVVRFDYNEADKSWSVSSADMDAVKFMTLVDDNHVQAIGIDGAMHTYTLDQAGVMAYSAAVAPAMMANR